MALSFSRGEVEFQFLSDEKNVFSNFGEIKVNNKRIVTPCLWLGHIIDLSPRPWETIEMDNLMLNAYYIIDKPSTYKKVCEQGIHDYLDYHGLILMDSGGFIFQKKDLVNLDPLKLVELYEKSKPDIGVVLDHPFDPNNSNKANQKRWDKTLENTEIMVNASSKIPLMPVLHGYSLKDLEKACNQIKSIDDDPKMIGLGSLVPLIYTTTAASKRFSNCMEFVFEAIKLIRHEFPDSMLHAFGVGSAFTMHLMYAMGTDSLDSTGWRTKAAYGMIQLPGVGDRYPKTRNNGRTVLNDAEKEILDECQCPTCESKNIEDKVNLLNDKFPARALHNAWTFKKEEQYFKNALENGEIRKFLDLRLKGSYYSKRLDYIINSKETKPLSGWI
jgi:tRNA-guanine family transglycosylase